MARLRGIKEIGIAVLLIVGGLVGVVINWFELIANRKFWPVASVFAPLGFVMGIMLIAVPYPDKSKFPKADFAPKSWAIFLFIGIILGFSNWYLRIEKAYQLIRDLFVFTDKRLILMDRQGITGNKVEYHSLPYQSITRFSIETAGHFDLDAELKIWITGSPAPLQKRFNRKLNIYQVQAVLASYVLK